MAGLPWLKLASDWKGSKKAIRLRVFLQDEWAWAYVVSLWMWTAQHEGDGSISGPGAVEVIADAAGWRGDPQHFVDCMLRAGLLDEITDGFYVHDWHDYAGAHAEKAERERARLRSYRERTRTERVRNAYVQETNTDVHGERERETEKKKAAAPDRLPTKAERQRTKYPRAVALLDLLADDFPDTAPVATDPQLAALDREAERRGGPAALAAACVAFVEARGGKAPGTVAYFASVIPDLPRAEDIRPARTRGQNPKPGDPDFNDPDAWGDFDAFLARDAGASHAS